ncbi:MAG: helix-turn-helix transcriptional regulator [Victivallales bacterium]|nr:helix-turn-helix transcriptional regulator [Victivallales bacterium]
MKKNILLRPEWLEVIERPFDWRIVSTLFAPDAPTARDRSHIRWHAGHADRHANREVVIALSGECVMSLEGALYEVSPGTVLMFDSGEEHDMAYPPWTSGCFHLWISFVRNVAFPRVLSIDDGVVSTVNAQAEPLMRLSELGHALPRVWSECAKGADNGGATALMRARVVSSLSGVLLEYASLGFVEESEVATDSTKRREKVVDAIKEHISETAGAGVSLDRLAVISGYSKYHFLRMFKERTGITVHEYVNQCRMAKCRELLGEGVRKNEISDILGFSSPATFSRWLHSEDARR